MCEARPHSLHARTTCTVNRMHDQHGDEQVNKSKVERGPRAQARSAGRHARGAAGLQHVCASQTEHGTHGAASDSRHVAILGDDCTAHPDIERGEAIFGRGRADFTAVSAARRVL